MILVAVTMMVSIAIVNISNRDQQSPVPPWARKVCTYRNSPLPHVCNIIINVTPDRRTDRQTDIIDGITRPCNSMARVISCLSVCRSVRLSVRLRRSRRFVLGVWKLQQTKQLDVSVPIFPVRAILVAFYFHPFLVFSGVQRCTVTSVSELSWARLVTSPLSRWQHCRSETSIN